MRFQTSDPDIETIVRRIEKGTIDLQPDFQRGEVWTVGKKQRLVDSILRGWHVPPLHLVARGGGRFDVLDGQQRLTAVRDFLRGKFPIDGRIEPVEDRLAELHGSRWADLPADVRNEFEAFPIRVFELHDFSPAEPHELFFRLNQPTNLTEAEKRNAFVGGPRDQIKQLVAWASERGLNQERVGFSNARMAYDDLLARFLLTVEQRNLTEKVTAMRITNRYRDTVEFDDRVMQSAAEAIDFVLKLPVLEERKENGYKPNKATLHTWFVMAAELWHHSALSTHGDLLERTIEIVEGSRTRRYDPNSPVAFALTIFNDRATSRVADVSSVILRDLSAWVVACSLTPESLHSELPMLAKAAPAWQETSATKVETEKAFTALYVAEDWGVSPWL